jgi:hypothetical protein
MFYIWVERVLITVLLGCLMYVVYIVCTQSATIELREDGWVCTQKATRTRTNIVGKVIIPITEEVCIAYERK